ncbi:MAG: hypothetical protein MZV70_13185 [Desulfobacterales bacterium]|nr:hypothetical protein [Desulfobacterales bacterium]
MRAISSWKTLKERSKSSRPGHGDGVVIESPGMRCPSSGIGSVQAEGCGRDRRLPCLLDNGRASLSRHRVIT